MGTKRDRIAEFAVQRPVNWDEKAVSKIIAKAGFVYVDVKYDGIRGVVFFDQQVQRWRIVTRENIEIVSITNRVDEICRHIGIASDTVLDCEVVIPGIPFEEASGLLRRLEPLSNDYLLNLYVFDVISSGKMRERSLFISYKPTIPYHCNMLGPVKRQTATTLDEVYALFEQARSLGFEGVVVKDPEQNYTGSKVKGWFKLKPSETQDGIITDFVWGVPGKANEGKIVGFMVQLEDGTTCKATGITQELMALVTADMESYRGRYVEIERMESTGGGNSRHPHFKCFRDMADAKGIKV